MYEIQAVIKDFDARADVQVVRRHFIEMFQLRIFPKELRSIQNIHVKVDRISLNKQLTHLSSNFFAGKRDFALNGRLSGNKASAPFVGPQKFNVWNDAEVVNEEKRK